MFTIDQLSYVKEDFEKVMIDDRDKYSFYYDTIEQFISKYSDTDKPIIVGGSFGINLLLKKKKEIDDYTYELYSENALDYVNKLTNLLVKDHIIYTKTTIPYQQYMIVIDNRRMVYFNNLFPGNTKLIKPIKINKMVVMSPEMQLIDLYRTLYSPQLAGNWETSVKDENKLIKLMRERIDEFSSDLENVKQNSKIEGSSENDNQKINKKDRNIIEEAILQEFVLDNPKVVMIGDHALKTIMPIEKNTNIIACHVSGDYFKQITDIIHKASGRFVSVVKYTREMRILKDFNLTRTIVKVGSEQKEVMYIYNSPDYDLIPFNKIYNSDKNKKLHFIQIGNPFVILRFMMINIWMLRLVGSKNADIGFVQKRITNIMKNLITLRTMMTNANTITTIVEKESNLSVFQNKDYQYLGIYQNDIISQKKKSKGTKKFNDYFPQEYKNKFGSYRSF